MTVQRFTSQEVQRWIPHRGRALLVDELIIPDGVTLANLVVGGISARSLHQITEADCEGHVAGFPILAGVLRQEFIYQTLAAVAGYLLDLPEDRMVFLTQWGPGKAVRPAVPGDLIAAEVRITQLNPPVLEGAGRVVLVGSWREICSVDWAKGRIGSRSGSTD